MVAYGFQSWEPGERYRKASPIPEFHGQRVVCDGDRSYRGSHRFNCQSIQTTPHLCRQGLRLLDRIRENAKPVPGVFELAGLTERAKFDEAL